MSLIVVEMFNCIRLFHCFVITLQTDMIWSWGLWTTVGCPNLQLRHPTLQKPSARLRGQCYWIVASHQFGWMKAGLTRATPPHTNTSFFFFFFLQVPECSPVPLLLSFPPSLYSADLLCECMADIVMQARGVKRCSTGAVPNSCSSSFQRWLMVYSPNSWATFPHFFCMGNKKWQIHTVEHHPHLS